MDYVNELRDNIIKMIDLETKGWAAAMRNIQSTQERLKSLNQEVEKFQSYLDSQKKLLPESVYKEYEQWLVIEKLKG